MKSRDRLPDFIVIGAMKAATTSLQYYLSRHPEILMSDLKETNFFAQDELWQQGIEFYKEFFRPSFVKRIGEISPNYSKYPFFPNVPERMFEILPNVKIIYVVRNPLERMISQYLHAVMEGSEKRTMLRAFSEPENNEYLLLSSYKLQAQRYKRFKNFLMVRAERLHDYREKELNRIFTFLDLDHFWHKDYDCHHHSSEQKIRLFHLGAEQKLYAEALLRKEMSNLNKSFWQDILAKLEDQISYCEGILGETLLEWRNPDLASAKVSAFLQELRK